ncbi:hypothetical protein VE00_10667 [Pseudogymnoascus sp. WSF 3629]|nr:hypothetical protein VE00_10667 [Pseudogymnoascus sp. WSF 3629]
MTAMTAMTATTATTDARLGEMPGNPQLPLTDQPQHPLAVTGDAGNRAQDPNNFDSLTIDVTVTINGVAHTEKALIDSGSQANFIS